MRYLRKAAKRNFAARSNRIHPAHAERYWGLRTSIGSQISISKLRRSVQRAGYCLSIFNPNNGVIATLFLSNEGLRAINTLIERANP